MGRASLGKIGGGGGGGDGDDEYLDGRWWRTARKRRSLEMWSVEVDFIIEIVVSDVEVQQLLQHVLL